MGFVLKCLNPFCGLSDLRKTAIFFAQFKNIWIISIVCVCRKWLIFNTQLVMGKSFLQVKHLNSWRCCVVWKNFLANLICMRYAENIFDCFKTFRFIAIWIAKVIYITCLVCITGHSVLPKVSTFPIAQGINYLRPFK